MPAGTKWDVSGGVEGDRAKIEADDEVNIYIEFVTFSFMTIR